MSKTILVADDSQTIRKVVELTFQGTDYAIVSVASADQALAALQSAQPDVVLADASLMGVDGYELCRRIKAHSGGQLPVVLLSSQYRPFDPARGSAVSADGHLDKPFTTQTLINQVRSLMGEEIIEEAPISFAEALLRRSQPEPPPVEEEEAAPQNGGPPHPFGAPQQPANRPNSDLLIEEPEELPVGTPALEPPSPSTAPRPNVDMWALSDDSQVPTAGPPPEQAYSEAPMRAPSQGAPMRRPAVRVHSDIKARAAESVARAAAESIPPGLSSEELHAIARDVIEKIAWEVVPDLAESIIRQELKRLLDD